MPDMPVNNKTKPDHGKKFKLNKKVEETISDHADPNYSLIKKIVKSPYYGKSPSRTDEMAVSFLEEHCEIGGAGNIVPGQLIMFKYFEPKTEEDLLVYDAHPVTIFFNVFKSKEGKRVLGFNIHYYPPRMRYQIMNTIFNIYKPIYTKYFKEGTKKSINEFDYKYLVESLKKAGLDFGVREYIPNLISEVRRIPPQLWHVAVFTEGWFKKQTRTAVMNYWKRWVRGEKSSSGGKAKSTHSSKSPKKK